MLTDRMTRMGHHIIEEVVMLVPSRKTSETIHLGSNIVIQVLEMRGGKVRIGIDAPGSIKILRGELVDRPAPIVGDHLPPDGMAATA